MSKSGSASRRRRGQRIWTWPERTTEVRWFHPQFETLEDRHVLSAVVGLQLFYDNSSFDGGVSGVSPLDDSAIATDKTAYLPDGNLAEFTAVSSYSRGINGIMIDLSAGGNHAAINGSDFIFQVGNNNTPSSWAAAPTPAAISVRPDFNGSGVDRVEIVWADGVIKNQWLKVQVLPTSRTGLSATDVFFWGNKIGDIGDPTPTSFTTTASGDGTPIISGGLGPAGGITNPRDIDRSNVITAAGDRAPALANIGAITRLDVLLVAPALNAGLSNDTGPGGVPNADSITQDATITGTLVETAPISGFWGTINAGLTVTNLLPLVQPDDTFTINAATLDAMYGGPIPDGTYTVQLQADDTAGLTAVENVSFTLKRSIGTPLVPDLTAASDSGASPTDNLTKFNTPTIEVTGEAGATITLYRDGSPVGSQSGSSPLSFVLPVTTDGGHSITAKAVDGAGNESAFSPALSITIDTVAPAISATTAITFGDDTTPHVTVTASDAWGLPNGTEIRLDVDINNDGDFLDSGETSRTLSSLYNGSRYFELTPALPATDVDELPYLMQLRGRVTDLAGNEGTSALNSHWLDTLGSTALQSYVNAADPNPLLPSIAAAATPTIAGAGYTVYVFDFKSQTWRTSADVNKTEWQHWLQIIVPTTVTETTALLYITGGSTGGQPTTLNSDRIALGSISASTGMISVLLPTVPNQPLDFTDPIDPPGVTRSEDDIIALSFIKYLQTGDPTWIALLPMVKSAVKAMDAVIAQVPIIAPGKTVTDFIVNGYSKRGWTTWLTGAASNKVKAVIPGVIDLLNLDESMVHHYGFYGFFADAVQDYQESGFNLIQNSLVEANQEIGRIVDPYRYLPNSNLTNIPKLLLNSTGDEFFVPDSAQFYFSDIPGPKYLRYIPDTGHGLDARAIDSVRTFSKAITDNLTLPQYSWTIDPDGAIRVVTPDSPTAVRLWQATNPDGRDFRRSVVSPSIVDWTDTLLSPTSPGVYVGNVATPAAPAARAFMIELTFANSAIPSVPYVFTTEVRVVSNVPLTAWPFYMPTNPDPDGDKMSSGSAASLATIGNDDRNGLSFSLSASAASAALAPAPHAAVLLSESPPALLSPEEESAELPLDDWAWSDDDDLLDDPSDVDAIDAALVGLEDDAF